MKFIADNCEYIIKRITKIICNSDYTTINLLNDKSIFNTFMMDNNLSNYIPKIYTKHNVKFPCILKLPITYGGLNSKICQNEDNLLKYLNKEYIIQEYIKGNEECSFHMYIENGNIIYSIYYKIIHESDYYIQCGRMISLKY